MNRGMPPRRAGAPRLIEWTGERAVPWAPDAQMLYEHYHRYLWAGALVHGRRVLDVGSGEGFGAALLADVAASVTGIDVDERTVEHSQMNYAAEGLSFSVGSATDLGHLPDGAFDAIVAFEILEHVDKQAQMLAEIERLLADDGILIISTPDRRAYSEATGQVNPFHVRELSEPEFRALLQARFPHTRFFGQRAATGSRIETLEAHPGQAASHYRIARAGEDWQPVGPASPLYVLAVAGRGELPPVPDGSTLSDYGLTALHEALRAEREAEAAATATAEARQARARAAIEAEATARAAAEAQAAAGARAATEAEARAAEAATAAAQALALRDREAVTWAREVDLLAQQVSATEERRARERAEHEAATAHMRRELQRIGESVTWRAFQKGRNRLYGLLGGRDSALSHALSGTLRLVGRLATWRKQRVAGPAAVPAERGSRGPVIRFPTFEHPVVSIVIAVYDGAELTERCLRAILHSTDQVPYEIIVVDDGEDPALRELLDAVSGIVVLRNEQNLGYLRSVNRGSAEARGTHLVQLNNDTEPQPGWLASLLTRLDSDEQIGVVVAKLLFPDGRLQEAGSIVWRDGSAWNYGHGADEAAFPYNFARDVDYGSAAAMLVRGSLWRELGGFDERYGPGYYEDVDLCFAARAHGARVVYEPNARVIHVLGGSMGTDVTVGAKRYQVINRDTFAGKWAAALEEQLPGPAEERIDTAADRRRGRRVFVVDHAVPAPDQDAGSLRMFHLVQNLVELGYRVTFLPDNGAAPAPYTAQLQTLGVEVLYGPLNLPARLVGIAAETELAILSRPYVAARFLHLVREYLPGARVAYDTVDLHYVRERRRAELEGSPDLARSESFKELELGLARGVDVTLTVSEEEAEQLRTDAPGVVVEVVPLANPVWAQVPPRERRAGLLFVGNFAHTPNIDAATFLVRRIMPLVWRRQPGIRVTIAGGNAPAEVRALSAPNVDVAGWVPDLDPLVAGAAAMVAPLRYGAGVKGKVAQALASGLPVITTTLGAEGIDAEAGSEILIGDDPEELAARILELLADDELWRRLSENGQALLRRTSSPEAQRETLVRLLDGVTAS